MDTILLVGREFEKTIGWLCHSIIVLVSFFALCDAVMNPNVLLGIISLVILVPAIIFGLSHNLQQRKVSCLFCGRSYK